MLYPGFVSGSYESQSPFADLKRTVNWYPEPMESKSVPQSAALYPCPGLKNVRHGGQRQHPCVVCDGGSCYAVIGNTVYQVLVNNTASIVTTPQ
jgi:hypothetical protein